MLALKTWPSKSAREIAGQIGVSFDYVGDVRKQVSDTLHLPDRVTGKDGKSYLAWAGKLDRERAASAGWLSNKAGPADARTSNRPLTGNRR